MSSRRHPAWCRFSSSHVPMAGEVKRLPCAGRATWLQVSGRTVQSGRRPARRRRRGRPYPTQRDGLELLKFLLSFRAPHHHVPPV
jgi:hypothetical protein